MTMSKSKSSSSSSSYNCGSTGAIKVLRVHPKAQHNPNQTALGSLVTLIAGAFPCAILIAVLGIRIVLAVVVLTLGVSVLIVATWHAQKLSASMSRWCTLGLAIVVALAYTHTFCSLLTVHLVMVWPMALVLMKTLPRRL